MIQRPKPIADQVEALLIAKIQEGEFAPGSRLPPENELAARLGVSRTSIRTALTTLEAKRLVVRRQGDGTYLNRRVMEVNTRLGDEWDFKQMIEDSGRAARIETLKVELQPAGIVEATALEVPLQAQVLSIYRLFRADERPVIYSRNVIPAGLLKTQGPYDVEQTIRQILQAYCEQDIFYSISDISATLPTQEVRGYLALSPLEPVLRFNDTFFNQKDLPLVYGLNYYYDQALRLRVTRSWG